MARVIYFMITAIVILFSSQNAFAKAHCYCVLGPSGSPFHNFGELSEYKTQLGHDNHCSGVCKGTANSWLNDPQNKAAMCTASGGGAFISYSKVGTRPYKQVSSYACASAANAGASGSIIFSNSPPLGNANSGVSANGKQFVSSGSTTGVFNGTSFVTFSHFQLISQHFASNTYTANLYRDNVLIDTQTAKTPCCQVKGTVARVTFAQQADAFVKGHTWKVMWVYQGKSPINGTIQTFIQ